MGELTGSFFVKVRTGVGLLSIWKWTCRFRESGKYLDHLCNYSFWRGSVLSGVNYSGCGL